MLAILMHCSLLLLTSVQQLGLMNHVFFYIVWKGAVCVVYLGKSCSGQCELPANFPDLNPIQAPVGCGGTIGLEPWKLPPNLKHLLLALDARYHRTPVVQT